MTTLADIAKLLNVAPSTVSRALTKPHLVSEKTRQDVLAAIKQTGYKVNLQARGLRRGTSTLIGVVISDLSDPIMAKTAALMQDYAIQRGYFAIAASTNESTVKEAEILEKFSTCSIAGLVICPTLKTPSHLEMFAKDIPVVELDRSTYTFLHDEFRMDDRAAMQIASNYLIDKGHKEIFVIIGDSTIVASFKERALGLATCSDRAKYNLVELPALDAQGLKEHAFEAVSELLNDKHNKNTAIIAGNSAIALGAMLAINKKKMVIGKDLDLFSIDNADWISSVPYPIACLDHPLPKAGYESIRRLVHRIEMTHTGDPETRLLVPKLIKPFTYTL